MSQQNPKPAAKHASSASSSASKPAANKAAANATHAAESIQRHAQESVYNAAETTRKAAQNVVDIGGNAARDALSSSMRDFRDTQDKVHAMSREGVENIARSADTASRLAMELVGLARGNIDACVECGNITAGAAKNMSAEAMEACNRAFSDAVDLSKDIFNCRTVNDVVDLHNRVFRQWIDTFFNETSKLANMAFECCTEAMEPLNERMSDASEQFCKALAA